MSMFYGVYFVNPELSAALDVIRFFAEPDYYRRAHITIRGPYENRLSSQLERKLEATFSKSGRLLEVCGVASFFIGNEPTSQNTVFLKCELDGAEQVWRKPDFSDAKPHVTLYDGNSRQFALALRHQLKQYEWRFFTRTTNLEILEKKKDPTEYLGIYFRNAQSLCDRLFGGEVNIDSFDMKSDTERLYLIDRVSRYINISLRSGKSFIY